MAYSQSGKHALTPLVRTDEENPSFRNMGEGFINRAYNVINRNSKIDIKRLPFFMPDLFDYLVHIVFLARVSLFTNIFSRSANTPMDDYGCTGKRYEANQVLSDKLQYACMQGARGSIFLASMPTLGAHMAIKSLN